MVKLYFKLAERLVFAPLIGAGFAWVFILVYVVLWFAKAVTITNGVYTMLAVANI